MDKYIFKLQEILLKSNIYYISQNFLTINQFVN